MLSTYSCIGNRIIEAIYIVQFIFTETHIGATYRAVSASAGIRTNRYLLCRDQVQPPIDHLGPLPQCLDVVEQFQCFRVYFVEFVKFLERSLQPSYFCIGGGACTSGSKATCSYS